VLFDARDRERIRAGQVTLTYRAWRAPQAKVGGLYRFGEGRIAVESVTTVTAADITPEDARLAGYTDADAVLTALTRRKAPATEPDTALYRVAFRYEPHPVPSRTRDLDHDAVSARLANMDTTAGRPWTMTALRAIADRPQVAARILAADGGMETLAFKANVRKLKALGLTISHETGYELTALGRDVLSRAEGERR